jgi:hypothetical protein
MKINAFSIFGMLALPSGIKKQVFNSFKPSKISPVFLPIKSKVLLFIYLLKTNIMKNKMKQLTAIAVVMLLGKAVSAQTNLNLNSTTNAVAKATVNTSKVADVISKTTQATTKVVQATGKVVQTTANVTTRTTANITAKTNAAANAGAKGNEASVKNETAVNARVKGETKTHEQGTIVTDVKELAVTEAKGIRTTTSEIRNEVKPGLNISSNTDATAQSEFSTGNGSGADAEVNGTTEANTDAKLKTENVKNKADNAKAGAKQKAKTTVKKVKNTKAAADVEVSASSNSTVAAGAQ